MQQPNKVEIDLINEKLKERFGTHIMVNKANFRLTWTGDAIEKRNGVFTKWDDSDNFLGYEYGVQEVPKYPYLEDNSWTLERLIPNPWRDVVCEDGYNYEAVYNFKIMPIFRACEFFIEKVFVKRESAIPHTEKEALYLDNEKKQKEIAEARNMLDSTHVTSALHDGAGSFFDSTKQQMREGE